MLICGIDPGVTGSAVILDDATDRVLAVLDLPLVRIGKLAWLEGATFRDWVEEWRPDAAIIELVHYRAGDPNPTNTSLMVRIAGGCEAMLSALDIPMIARPRPIDWMKLAKIPTGLTRDEREKRYLAVAKATLGWPEGALYLNAHKDRAAAALIARHGRKPTPAPKPPKRSKAVERKMAENVPPGPLFGAGVA